MNTVITKDIIEQSMAYPSYVQLIDELLAEGKTTGEHQSETMFHYTTLNRQRMKRLDKTTALREDLQTALQTVQQKWIWFILTEAWCGDAAQNIPVIQKMAEQNDHITIRLILRDEHPDIINAYLTNGGKAIPKLVCLQAESLKEIGLWGPRPAPAQNMVMEYKDKEDKEPYSEFVKKLQLWYAKDKTQTIQEEFLRLVENWSKVV